MGEKEPRILMTIDAFHVGGTETSLLSISKELLRNDIYIVIIASNTGTLADEFYSLGCPVYIGLNEDNVRQIIKENKINIIHSHDPTAFQIHSLAKEFGIPHIYTLHSVYPIPYFSFDPNIIKMLSVSHPIYDYLLAQGISSIIIPNGIDLIEYTSIESSNLRTSLNIPDEAPVIVYASRLGDIRKLDICMLLLEACRQLKNETFPSLHVVIAGESIYSGHMDTLTSRLESIHRSSTEKFIHILGPRRDMPNVYSIANCVVGTGRVALEAMACEKVVVAVGYDGFLGLVAPDSFNKSWQYYFGDHKSTSPYSKELIASDLRKILSSPNLQASWGKQSREFIKDNFDINYIKNQLVSFYSSLLENKGD